ncbi:helix-turn-helix domain-containing protein [Methylobacterium sp. 190mf]|uniref:helix-turn-helix domain-containing protein n=1 Tax=Methylobacterium sp. 190mf TaxID=1761798 RepID=UPI001AECED88|nr:helix-turn-helix domain-containing protein [Methylobacterium sp. 190mf]
MNIKFQGAAGNLRAPMEKLAYTIPETCYVTGLGRTTVYNLMAKSKLQSLKVGGRTIITADSVRRFLASLETGA